MLQQIKSAMRRSSEWNRNRREYAYLTSMDDYMLRDIGVHRGDIRSEVTGRDRAF